MKCHLYTVELSHIGKQSILYRHRKNINKSDKRKEKKNFSVGEMLYIFNRFVMERKFSL